MAFPTVTFSPTFASFLRFLGLLNGKIRGNRAHRYSGWLVQQGQDERRRTPRYPFIATVEVLQKGAQAGISARITELSLYGCYIEMPDPFAKGSELLVKVYANGKYFETEGIAVYAVNGQGTGVRFQNVKPHYMGVIKQWLIEAALAKFGKKRD